MARLGMTQNKIENDIKVIGLTGGTGSGKTVVAEMLSRRGGYVINADLISREIMVNGHEAYHEVIAAFGTNILGQSGEIDRKKLGEIVFSDPNEKKRLEEITHKYILMEIKAQISKIKLQPGAYEFIILDAPLLIESGLHRDVDTVWLMRAGDDNRKKRVMARDSLSPGQAAKRMASQSGFEELSAYADEIIDNDGDLKSLETRVGEILGWTGG